MLFSTEEMLVVNQVGLTGNRGKGGSLIALFRQIDLHSHLNIFGIGDEGEEDHNQILDEKLIKKDDEYK